MEILFIRVEDLNFEYWHRDVNFTRERVAIKMQSAYTMLKF